MTTRRRSSRREDPIPIAVDQETEEARALKEFSGQAAFAINERREIAGTSGGHAALWSR